MADYYDNTTFNTNPPPYFDDGTAGSLTLFAANTARWPRAPARPRAAPRAPTRAPPHGTVPASTSVAHEAAGTEVVFTSPGSRAARRRSQVTRVRRLHLDAECRAMPPS